MALLLLDDTVDSIEPELQTEPERYGSGPGGSNRPPRRTQEGQPDTLPTEESLPQLYRAMSLLGADVVSYTLPEEIVLPLSAAFIGYPAQLVQETPKANFDYLIKWCRKHESNTVIVINSKINGTLFAYIHKGQLVGSFCLESKNFSLNREEISDFIASDPAIELYASILPNEIVAKTFHFGFELKL